MSRRDVIVLSGARVSVAQVCTLRGANHRTQALANSMQRRGEIRRVGAVRHLVGGRVELDYVRLRPGADMRRRLVFRALVLSASAAAFLLSVGVMLYGARHALLSLAGAGLLLLSLLYLATRGRHRARCTGLHCPGCH